MLTYKVTIRVSQRLNKQLTAFKHYGEERVYILLAPLEAKLSAQTKLALESFFKILPHQLTTEQLAIYKDKLANLLNYLRYVLKEMRKKSLSYVRQNRLSLLRGSENHNHSESNHHSQSQEVGFEG